MSPHSLWCQTDSEPPLKAVLKISTLTGDCPQWLRRRADGEELGFGLICKAKVSGVKDTSAYSSKNKIRFESFEQLKTPALGWRLYRPAPRGWADQWLLKVSFQDGYCNSQRHELKMLPQKNGIFNPLILRPSSPWAHASHESLHFAGWESIRSVGNFKWSDPLSWSILH